jgi:hypothetical protein
LSTTDTRHQDRHRTLVTPPAPPGTPSVPVVHRSASCPQSRSTTRVLSPPASRLARRDVPLCPNKHHAVGLDPDGKRPHDGPLPNSEPRLSALFDKLTQHGTLLVAVDQPTTIGLPPGRGHPRSRSQVAYLPDLAMAHRRPTRAGPRPTPRAPSSPPTPLPHTLRPVDDDETLAELKVLVGFDDNLTSEATHISNRNRGLLTGIHPASKSASGPKIAHPAVLKILSSCGGPTAPVTHASGTSVRGETRPDRQPHTHKAALIVEQWPPVDRCFGSLDALILHRMTARLASPAAVTSLLLGAGLWSRRRLARPAVRSGPPLCGRPGGVPLPVGVSGPARRPGSGRPPGPGG